MSFGNSLDNTLKEDINCFECRDGTDFFDENSKVDESKGIQRIDRDKVNVLVEKILKKANNIKNIQEISI